MYNAFNVEQYIKFISSLCSLPSRRTEQQPEINVIKNKRKHFSSTPVYFMFSGTKTPRIKLPALNIHVLDTGRQYT